MTDDEQTLTALEDELRTLAARDRDGAEQLAADMTARMLACMQTECRHQRLLRYLRHAGSVAALLAVLAVAGVLLVPTGGDTALVKTSAPESGQAKPRPLPADVDSLPVPQLVHGAVEMMGLDMGATDDAPAPESRPETATFAVVTNTATMGHDMPTPAAGAPAPSPFALRKSAPEPSLQERVVRILTTEEQPYAKLHAVLSQAPTRCLKLNRGNCSLTLTSKQGGAIVIFIQQPGCKKVEISLSTPSDTLPPQVRELVK